MPNHVTHRIKITGPVEDVERFRKTAIVTKEEEVNDWVTGGKKLETFTGLDFNVFVPMPEILRNSESSSAVDDGLTIMEFDARQKGETFDQPRRAFGLPRTIESMLEWPWVKEEGITSAKALRDRLVERNPDCLPKAEAALKAYKECGHTDWYSWSCENWGTKWNAYGYEELASEPGHFEFQIETAWSPPEPVFRAMSEAFPDLCIDIIGFDEGWGFGYDASFRRGLTNGGLCDATDELYEAVYGFPPEKYDDFDPEAEEEATV